MASRDGAALPLAASRQGRPGFTLTELMIAVVVLIVIILATSKIFSAASRVASVGQATADVMQEAAAIERQLRQDIARMSHEGFFAIRCIAVRNDLNQTLSPTLGPPLINPLLPPEAYVRADQLMFFTAGAASSQAFFTGPFVFNYHKAQSNATCVYYGHGFQLPSASAKTVTMLQAGSLGPTQYLDAKATFANTAAGVYPWSFDPDSAVGGGLQVIRVDKDAVFVSDPSDAVPGTQPNALQWMLARQAVLLADDGGGVDVFLSQGASAESLWAPTFTNPGALPIRNGRRDAIALQMNDIRDHILRDQFNGEMRNWEEQRTEIAGAMSYPRTERVAPTMRRGDQALTNSVIAGACSSFRIDWTYADGVGKTANQKGDQFIGNVVPPGEQPWFGLDELFDPDAATGSMPDSQTGVLTFIQYMNFLNDEGYLPAPSTLMFAFPSPALSIGATNVEQFKSGLSTCSVSWVPPGVLPSDPDAAMRVYEAFFGFNQDAPIGPLEFQVPMGAFAPGFPPTVIQPDAFPRPDLGYAPWPTAIRVTMTLHDVDSKLQAGREFQFVIKLPERAGTP